MNLLFIHGRAQGKRSQPELEEEWTTALNRGFDNASLSRPADLKICHPFYGARLDELTDLTQKGLVQILERGASGDKDSVSDFEMDLILLIAENAGVTREEIARELESGVVERGPENWEWVQAIGKAIAKKVTWIADVSIAQFTEDVHAYLTNIGIRDEIHEIVREAMPAPNEPCVVVAHSLGSIVGYWLLHELGSNVNVPLLMTVGSPLGIPSIKDKLPIPLGCPTGVTNWINVADERDPVALFSKLDNEFPAQIKDIASIDNPKDHPHGIKGYLSNATVASELHNALTGG